MNGILLINKEKNYTSRDVVNIISKHLKIKKVGHAGTLDPLATGLLVVCVGKATKLVELLSGDEKTYVAEVTLGITTDTLDNEGVVLEEKKCIIEENKIKKLLNEMIGKYYQEVPIYSAVKINGKKLYEYARNQQEVDLPKRLVSINSLELIDNIYYNNDKTIFKIKCNVSKGTYIRGLVRDIASELGTIGLMSDLVRLNQGGFELNQAITIEQFLNNDYSLISICDALTKYPKIVVDNNFKKDIMNGKILDNIYNNEEVFFIDQDNNPLALYKIYNNNHKKLKPWKMFV